MSHSIRDHHVVPPGCYRVAEYASKTAALVLQMWMGGVQLAAAAELGGCATACFLSNHRVVAVSRAGTLRDHHRYRA
jgi:hypothetical protein